MSTHDDDTDPTGVRALLRALPDPGPMPADLSARITRRLEELGGEGLDAVTPLPDGARSSRGAPAGSPRTRRSAWVRHSRAILAAAVVLVAGGTAASLAAGGLLGSGSSLWDSAASGAASTSKERAVAGRDSSAVEAGPAVGAVRVHASGRNYTAAQLSSELPDLSTATPLPTLSAESPSIGPIGTELGVRSCLEALGVDRDAGADVDLATVDGAPAAVIVLTGTGGARTAYAVRRECTTGNPALIAGPVTGR